VAVGLGALLPLGWQLPRWIEGLDPTFVHPSWYEQANLPFVLHMSAIHPLIWICVAILAFVRICRNYDWELAK
jgi:hypothetical protein